MISRRPWSTFLEDGFQCGTKQNKLNIFHHIKEQKLEKLNVKDHFHCSIIKNSFKNKVYKKNREALNKIQLLLQVKDFLLFNRVPSLIGKKKHGSSKKQSIYSKKDIEGEAIIPWKCNITFTCRYFRWWFWKNIVFLLKLIWKSWSAKFLLPRIHGWQRWATSPKNIGIVKSERCTRE